MIIRVALTSGPCNRDFRLNPSLLSGTPRFLALLGAASASEASEPDSPDGTSPSGSAEALVVKSRLQLDLAFSRFRNRNAVERCKLLERSGRQTGQSDRDDHVARVRRCLNYHSTLFSSDIIDVVPLNSKPRQVLPQTIGIVGGLLGHSRYGKQLTASRRKRLGSPTHSKHFCKLYPVETV